MISVAQVKELVRDTVLSDEEAEHIRDACYCLAELVLQAFLARGKRPKDGDSREQPGAQVRSLDGEEEKMVR